MSAQQSPPEILRETRSIAQCLKEDLKCKEAFDREAEFKRKSLRKLYIKLLLLYPNTKETKDSETHLWMQTSYQFISVYKQRIAVLDNKLFPSNPQAAIQKNHKDSGGRVEYRKLLSRFRQFLAEEEKFFVRLLIRFRTQFGLDEVHPALVKANILTDDSDDAARNDTGRDGFPDVGDAPLLSNEERETQIAIFAKLLVCLGDIARYREQYNDGGGRPRAGHEEGAPKRSGRGGKKGNNQETRARPRNYGRAWSIYEQARLLVPNDGNAFHQLAILSSYQRDNFQSLFHYYRALCVRQPYDTASDNVITVLKKAMEQYRRERSKPENSSDESSSAPLSRVKRFKDWVVILHWFWYLGDDDCVTRASKHSNAIISEFKALILDRILPNNVIMEAFVLSFSSLWVVCMIRDMPIRCDRKSVERRVIVHIVDMMRTLVEVGKSQLSENIQEDMGRDQGKNGVGLAQLITAAFRRTLPAIRVCSKWLRSNIDYVDNTKYSSATPSDGLPDAIDDLWGTYFSFISALGSTFPISELPELTGPLEEDVELYGFASISTSKKNMLMNPHRTVTGQALGQEAVHPNEEYLMRIADVLKDAQLINEYRSFPIKPPRSDSIAKEGHAVLGESLTVNSNGKVILSDPPILSIAGDEVDTETEIDFDNATQTSRTEDDVIRDAFNAALRDDLSEEDEKIVWPKFQRSPLQVTSPLKSPTIIYESPSDPNQETRKAVQPPQSIQTKGQTDSIRQPNILEPSGARVLDDHPPGWQKVDTETGYTSFTVGNGKGPTGMGVGTTAQDLLNNVLSRGKPDNKSKNQLFGHQNRSQSISYPNLGHPQSEYTHSSFGPTIHSQVEIDTIASLHEQLDQSGSIITRHHGVTPTTPQSALLFGSVGSKSLISDSQPHVPSKSIWGNLEASVSGHNTYNRTSIHPTALPRFSLAPGHERGRSLSMSISNTQSWSPLANIRPELAAQVPSTRFMSGPSQDPIYQTPMNEKVVSTGYQGLSPGSGYSGKPSVDHSMNRGRNQAQLQHHRSMGSMSGFPSISGLSALQGTDQVVYDSHLSGNMGNMSLDGEPVGQGADLYPHSHYVPHHHAPLPIHAPSVQRSIWNT